MKLCRFYLFYLIVFLLTSNVQAITLVYSVRIRSVFESAHAALEDHKKSSWVATALPIIYVRDRHIVDPARSIDVCEHQIIGGSLFNIRYIPSEHWWFEATTGLEKETACERGTINRHNSRVGFDDIVLSAGYNVRPSDAVQICLFGITGFPTHKGVTAAEQFDPLVGTRFNSLGAGAELSYNFIDERMSTLTGIFQTRFVHFFSRNWFPILPRDARIQPGNITDLLFSARYRYDGTVFETGYNPTFFTNQAVLLRTGTVHSENYVRNSIYATLSHGWKDFPGLHIPLILGTGLNIGRSHHFDTKIIAGWVSLTTTF